MNRIMNDQIAILVCGNQTGSIWGKLQTGRPPDMRFERVKDVPGLQVNQNYVPKPIGPGQLTIAGGGQAGLNLHESRRLKCEKPKEAHAEVESLASDADGQAETIIIHRYISCEVD